MIKAIMVAVFIGLIAASVAWASPYLEFSPDYAQSLLAATAATTVEQVFLPLNEHLSGFDVWVSGGGTAGNATFTLLNSSGTALGSRTITVPAIADGGSGSRLHVDLPSQIAVSGGSSYRVRIDTTMPTLRLYYAGANPLIAHNGVPLPAYTGGLARLDGDDMDFSFLYALYENAETTPPTLSNVAVSQPAVGTVVISFNATEPVDAQVQYGSSLVAYTGQFTQCLPGVQPCVVTLPVSPGTDYAFTLTARDAWGNSATAAGTFLSLGPTATPTPSVSLAPGSPAPTPDAVPPAISGLQATNLTPSSATIAWTTDETANGTVAVFFLPFLTFAGTANDPTLELVHAVTVGGLMEATGYRARVTSSDNSGNVSTAEVDFTTAQATPPPSGSTPTPTPTGPTPTPTVSVGPQAIGSGQGTEISWPTPGGGPPSDGYRVDIFDRYDRLIRTVSTDINRAETGELPEGDNRAIVYANNEGVFEKVAAPVLLRVTSQSFWEQMLALAPWILGAIVFIIAAVIGLMKYREKHKPPAAPPAAPSGSVMGAIPHQQL